MEEEAVLLVVELVPEEDPELPELPEEPEFPEEPDEVLVDPEEEEV